MGRKRAVVRARTVASCCAQSALLLRRSALPGARARFFIEGLPPSTDNAVFRRYFEHFGRHASPPSPSFKLLRMPLRLARRPEPAHAPGQVRDAVVMYDRDNRPHGFGFVTFGTDEAAAAMKSANHDKRADSPSCTSEPSRSSGACWTRWWRTPCCAWRAEAPGLRVCASEGLPAGTAM